MKKVLLAICTLVFLLLVGIFLSDSRAPRRSPLAIAENEKGAEPQLPTSPPISEAKVTENTQTAPKPVSQPVKGALFSHAQSGFSMRLPVGWTSKTNDAGTSTGKYEADIAQKIKLILMTPNHS